MRVFKFNKLVRDKIVEQQQANGSKPDFKVLNDAEYLEALKAKILEETAEIETQDPEGLLGELADVQEVIDCMLESIGNTKGDLAEAQAKKNEKAGSFKKKLFVENVSVRDDDTWVEYYLKNSDRYPEVKKEQ